MASVLSSTVPSRSPSGPALWPVRCGTTRRPCSAANRTTAITSASSAGTAISEGRWSSSRLYACLASSQPSSPGAIASPWMRPRRAATSAVGCSMVVMVCLLLRWGVHGERLVRRRERGGKQSVDGPDQPEPARELPGGATPVADGALEGPVLQLEVEGHANRLFFAVHAAQNRRSGPSAHRGPPQTVPPVFG